MHCLITFLGIFFIHFLLKETSGLTDRQKKTLYMKKFGSRKRNMVGLQGQGQGGGKDLKTDDDTMEISIESFEDDGGSIELG